MSISTFTTPQNIIGNQTSMPLPSMTVTSPRESTPRVNVTLQIERHLHMIMLRLMQLLLLLLITRVR
ncbi:hypothetical protein DPMN_010174 [Dreissena polymorpha]|uniref:Uncharacterized protein n=1 Tax=Dreissena polymorpha TaxID=45954 RepID=A0A9D4MYB5_DREPO|nr:hypothetical protein DPMN_010174 [Dreissena polymorpha]